MTAQELMTWAKNKYDVLVEKGLWESPSSEEQQMLALKTEIDSMKQKYKKPDVPKVIRVPTKPPPTKHQK